jgi:N-acetylmuramoyl-L-alanine amidase
VRSLTADSGHRPLEGFGVGIDPGHNGRNWTDPSYIDRPVWNGHNDETCDTTGTATDAGYTESLYNWNVAVMLRDRLENAGARVVMTRHSNDGIGPCVTKRAEILDRAHVDVAIDIHADGGPPGGRGFAVLVPVKGFENAKVIGSSSRFAREVRSAFVNRTPMPISDYCGKDGIVPRNDLAGLNLTTVPKVLIECGNLRNSTDASLLVTPRFQKQAARALLLAIENFLRSEHPPRSHAHL